MTGDQLKKSILKHAIEGKLVAQDPADEPAEALLKRIRAEKRKLLKEGKIKKYTESRIYKDEDGKWRERVAGKKQDAELAVPFELPAGWAWARVETVFQLINGDRGENYPAKTKLSASGEIPFISAVNMHNGTVAKDELLYLTQEQYELLRSGHLAKNDFVFCLRGSLGKFCLYPYSTGAIASSLVILRKYFPIPDGYIKAYLESPLVKSQVNANRNGTAQPNLSARSLANFLIPLPPLPEQRRIADKMERLEPLIAEFGRLEKELSKIEGELLPKLKKSILKHAIEGKLVRQDPADEPAEALLERIRAEKRKLLKEGKLKKSVESSIYKDEAGKWRECVAGRKQDAELAVPFELPAGWAWARLETVCWLVNPPKAQGEELPYLDAKTLRGKAEKAYLAEGRVVDVGAKIILVDGENSGEVFDVPFRGYLGSTFRVLESAHQVDMDYLNVVLDRYKDIFRWNKIGTAIPHLNKNLFKSLLIGLPPLAEQHRIAERVEAIFTAIDGASAEEAEQSHDG